MTVPDYKALCAELADDLELWVAYDIHIHPIQESHDLIDRARAALAVEPEPVPEGPSTDELYRGTPNLTQVRSLLGAPPAPEPGEVAGEVAGLVSDALKPWRPCTS